MSAPVAVLVCALGGEGGGVLAEWLYSAAVGAGYAAQATSIPGVAQRTGATTYYLEIGREPVAPGGDARPVFGLSPVPGGIDLLVSSELLETLRQAAAGLPSARRTTVITSSTRALTVAEKMVPGDGRADSAALVAALRRHAAAVHLLDLGALAREADTAISAVLFGAIAASGVLPLPRGAYEDAIRAAGKGVAASLRGFALAFDAVRALREAAAPALPAGAAANEKTALTGVALRALARQRLRAYQDEAYVRLFDGRLARIEAAARAAAAAAGPADAIGDEVARWLALWMAYDDIVRVAALKLAASRMERVRREAGAREGEVVQVFDHFKPGVAELAGLLPAPLAQRLLDWDQRRVAAGHEPWGWALTLRAHSLRGTLALWTLAALKRWRPRGQRFATEQQLIERWLAAVERGTQEHAALGLELARCGRLIKGYGATNERGKERLLHLIEHLAAGPASAAERAAAVRAAREAALADDTGRALDAVLVAHDAPARPLREQPVRWFKRRPGAAGPGG